MSLYCERWGESRRDVGGPRRIGDLRLRGKGIHWRFAGLYERIHLDSSTWELIFGENVLQERSQRSAEINIRYVDYPRICIDVCSGTKLFWRKHKDLVLLTLVHCTKASQLPLKKQKEIRKSVKINFFEINLSRSFRTLPKNSLAKYELQTRRFQLDPLIRTVVLSKPSMKFLSSACCTFRMYFLPF